MRAGEEEIEAKDSRTARPTEIYLSGDSGTVTTRTHTHDYYRYEHYIPLVGTYIHSTRIRRSVKKLEVEPTRSATVEHLASRTRPASWLKFRHRRNNCRATTGPKSSCTKYMCKCTRTMYEQFSY